MDDFFRRLCSSSRMSCCIYTIMKLYEKQEYMYKNRIHRVEHRGVSLGQLWLCPIVRGKVIASAEFGAKLDTSLDANGYARIEKISFKSYNESGSLGRGYLMVIIRSECLRIRYIGRVGTGHIAGFMEYGCPA